MITTPTSDREPIFSPLKASIHSDLNMLKHLGVASFVVFGIVINSQWGEGSGFGSLFSFSWDSGTGDLLENGELLEDSFPEGFVWGVATSAYQVIKK